VTIIGVDDTDSRKRGMCTTYVADTIARRLTDRNEGIQRILLVRCNPAVEHKTRGNAALAIHTDLDPGVAQDLVGDAVADAETDDPRTNPGAVVAPGDAEEVPDAVVQFAERAVQHVLDPATAREIVADAGFATREAGNGRGLVGALAAVGAWRSNEDWTYESIAYREREHWGTPRQVDRDSVFAAAEAGYPEVWDTVDRVEDTAVCVPRTPGPVLFGIRGDERGAVEDVAAAIESETVAFRHTFVTNQGTDAHLQDGTLGALEDGCSYRVDGTVVEAPETHEGGHVFFGLGPETGPEGGERGERGERAAVAADGGASRRCAAFEPTKRFRDRVRGLRAGDRVTVCGEVGDGTLKLEKFAVRDLVETEDATPTCPDCGRSMESAGADQGYRCRDCGTSTDGPVEQRVDRALEVGWYEVPPVARRHVAKPLVRGGFDAPVHPER